MIINYSFCSDINKHLPGPHFDPPSIEQVRSMMQVTPKFNAAMENTVFENILYSLLQWKCYEYAWTVAFNILLICIWLIGTVSEGLAID